MSTFILGTWNFGWVLEGSWFVSLPWSVIDWWIHKPKPMIQPLLLLDSGIGPRLTRMLFLWQKCESRYIEDVWTFRKTSPNHLFQCFTFIAKPMESCCKPSTTSRIVGERSQGHGSETTNGVSVARWTCHLFFPRNQNVVSFLNASNQPSFFFRGTLI